MNPAKLNTTTRLGILLKAAREKLSRSQGEVATKASISTSMLSQIERGQVSPSIDTLIAVCDALGIDAGQLFSRLSAERTVRVQHEGERLFSENAGIRFEQLAASSDPGHAAEMLMLEIEENAEAGKAGAGHEGVEMGFVLSGKAVIIIDNEEYWLEKGDSVTFSSALPHRIRNAGRGAFKAVWTALPPHRDYLK